MQNRSLRILFLTIFSFLNQHIHSAQQFDALGYLTDIKNTKDLTLNFPITFTYTFKNNAPQTMTIASEDMKIILVPEDSTLQFSQKNIIKIPSNSDNSFEGFTMQQGSTVGYFYAMPTLNDMMAELTAQDYIALSVSNDSKGTLISYYSSAMDRTVVRVLELIHAVYKQNSKKKNPSTIQEQIGNSLDELEELIGNVDPITSFNTFPTGLTNMPSFNFNIDTYNYSFVSPAASGKTPASGKINTALDGTPFADFNWSSILTSINQGNVYLTLLAFDENDKFITSLQDASVKSMALAIYDGDNLIGEPLIFPAQNYTGNATGNSKPLTFTNQSISFAVDTPTDFIAIPAYPFLMQITTEATGWDNLGYLTNIANTKDVTLSFPITFTYNFKNNQQQTMNITSEDAEIILVPEDSTLQFSQKNIIKIPSNSDNSFEGFTMQQGSTVGYFYAMPTLNDLMASLTVNDYIILSVSNDSNGTFISYYSSAMDRTVARVLELIRAVYKKTNPQTIQEQIGTNLSSLKKLIGGKVPVTPPINGFPTGLSSMPAFDFNFIFQQASLYDYSFIAPAFGTNPTVGEIHTALDGISEYANFNWASVLNAINTGGVYMSLLVFDANKQFMNGVLDGDVTWIALVIYDSAGNLLSGMPLIFSAQNYTGNKIKNPTPVSFLANIDVHNPILFTIQKTSIANFSIDNYPFLIKIAKAKSKKKKTPKHFAPNFDGTISLANVYNNYFYYMVEDHSISQPILTVGSTTYAGNTGNAGFTWDDFEDSINEYKKGVAVLFTNTISQGEYNNTLTIAWQGYSLEGDVIPSISGNTTSPISSNNIIAYMSYNRQGQPDAPAIGSSVINNTGITTQWFKITS